MENNDELRFYIDGDTIKGTTVICDRNRPHDNQWLLEVVKDEGFTVLDLLNDHCTAPTTEDK